MNVNSGLLTLRQKCLIAAGWRAEKDSVETENMYGMYWHLVNPERRHWNPDGYSLVSGYHLTESRAWEFGPAVESSVDAALTLLVDTSYELRHLQNSFYLCKIIIDVVVASAFGDTQALAICNAFMEWKGK